MKTVFTETNHWVSIAFFQNKPHIFRVVFYFVLLGFLSSQVAAEETGRFRILLPASSSGSVKTLDETSISGSVSKTVSIPFIGSYSTSLSVTGALREDVNESPTVTGFSLHYIFPFGLGLGYSSQVIKYKIDLLNSQDLNATGTYNNSATSFTIPSGSFIATESITLDLGNLDVFYVFDFFELFSATIGAGVPVIKSDMSLSVALKAGSTNVQSQLLDNAIQQSLASSTPENITAYSVFLMGGYSYKDFEFLIGYRQTQLKATFKLDSVLSNLINKNEYNWEVKVNEYLIGAGYRF